MPVGSLQLSLLAGFATFGAIGATLALVGLGLPFALAILLAATAAGLVQFAALRLTGPARMAAAMPPSATEDAVRTLGAYRAHTATLRHDLRGVLSPALMMSDRLLNHADPAVQRAGTAVVRSIERATALLTNSKDLMQADAPSSPQAGTATGEAPDPARLVR